MVDYFLFENCFVFASDVMVGEPLVVSGENAIVKEADLFYQEPSYVSQLYIVNWVNGSMHALL